MRPGRQNLHNDLVVNDSAFGGARISTTLLNVAEGVGAWAAREGSEETNHATEPLEERTIYTVGYLSSSKILGIRRLVTVVVSKGFTPMLILGVSPAFHFASRVAPES